MFTSVALGDDMLFVLVDDAQGLQQDAKRVHDVLHDVNMISGNRFHAERQITTYNDRQESKSTLRVVHITSLRVLRINDQTRGADKRFKDVLSSTVSGSLQRNDYLPIRPR